VQRFVNRPAPWNYASVSRPAPILRNLFHFAAAFLVLLACLSARGQFSTVAYESFSYSTGSLAGNNGGTGWTSAWTNDYHSGATLQVSATGMTYSGLTVGGGSAAWGSGGNGISEDSRYLPLMDSGIVYVQFLSQFGSSSGGGTPNLRLFDSGALTGGFGGNGGTYGAYVSILDTTLNPAANGSSSSSAGLSSLNLVVGQINYGADETMLWVDPNLSTFDYSDPPAPDATYPGLAPEFNEVAIYSRSPADFDELTIFQETPEPASSGLLLTGVVLAVVALKLGDKKHR
jgi:hypothetical protein